MNPHRRFSSLQLARRLCRASCAIVLLAAAGVAAAAAPILPRNGSVLALGDSVVFGYITQNLRGYVNADNFVGYPDYVGRGLRLNPRNGACPGETSGSFLSSTAADNGCRFFKGSFPLHVAYPSTQLQFAQGVLATDKHTRLVTVSLGANDLFILQNYCDAQPNPATCIANGLPAVLSTVGANMNAILGALRATGFRGVLMVVNYYSLDYTDAVETGLTAELNRVLAAAAAAHGAVVADAFSAFRTAASTNAAGGQTCIAGLLNPDPQNSFNCDVHPSQSGQQLLADTVEATYQALLAGQ